MPIDRQCQNQCRERDRLGDGNQRLGTEVAHHGAVHAEANEQWNGDKWRQREEPQVAVKRVDLFEIPQAYEKSQPQCSPYQHNVDGDLNQSFLATA